MVSTATTATTATKPMLDGKVVLVTGANGYIGSMLVKQLLEDGYKVRGTVRKLDQPELMALPNAKDNLQLVHLDLHGNYDDFVKVVQDDVVWVFHVAASVMETFHVDMKDEQKYIDTHVNGTLSLLKAAQQVGKVTKFIVTSSTAAINAGHDFSSSSRTSSPFTEDDWSIIDDGQKMLTYFKIKTLSEKAAWEYMGTLNGKRNFTLSTINPASVVGPACLSTTSSSFEIITRNLKGLDPAVADIFMPLVDIRDVVEAHIQAAQRDEAAGKRFLLIKSGDGEISMTEISKILYDEFAPMGCPVPNKRMPTWLIWIMSFFSKDLAMWYPMVGVRYNLDNTRSKEVLGLKYDRSIKESLIDGGYSAIKLGIVQVKKGAV